MRKLSVFKFFFATWMLCLAVSANGQGDTLTMRQIFDLKVGDTLIYGGSESGTIFSNNGGSLNNYESTWGFTIYEKDTTPDSITYKYQVLGSEENQQLSVYFPDSSILIKKVACSYYNGYPLYRMFNWLGAGVSFYQVQTCNTSDTITSCDMYRYIDTQFQNRSINQITKSYAEGNTGFAFMSGVGIFSASTIGSEYFGNICGNNLQNCDGDGFVQLIYYHSGNTIWIDTAYYNSIASISNLSYYPIGFKISPNPSTGDFYLETMNVGTDNSNVIKIYDLQSRLIYEDKLETTNHKQSINLSNASAGLYLISIENPTRGVIWRGRLVKL